MLLWAFLATDEMFSVLGSDQMPGVTSCLRKTWSTHSASNVRKISLCILKYESGPLVMSLPHDTFDSF